MKQLLVILFIIFSSTGFGQSIPQMQLNTSTYQPSTFTPSTYTPQQPDYSILQRSMQQREERANKSYEVYNKLIELYSEIEKEIPPTESEWYKNYAGKICKEVKDNIDIGNYGSAITMAYDAMSTLRNDKEIVYRKDSYKQYCEDMQNHGLYNYQNGRVNKTTYEWFCITNPYKFMPKYDTTGNIIGFKPVYVSYLYPSVNWQEVNQYFTSQGRTKDDIERLWTLYFTYDPDKMSSLSQEFNVTKFCLDYYLSILNNPNLSAIEKEQLQNDINAYRSILSDANGEISYSAYIENIKKQYIVQPQNKSKSNARAKNTNRRYTKSKKK